MTGKNSMENDVVDIRFAVLQEILKKSQANGKASSSGICDKQIIRKSFEELTDEEFRNVVNRLIKYKYLLENDKLFKLTSKGFNCVNSSNVLVQLLKIDTISLILLKNLYELHSKQPQLPVTKEILSKPSSGFSSKEVETCLFKLDAAAYVDVAEEEVFITNRGILLVKTNRYIKIIKIAAGIIAAMMAGSAFMSRYTDLMSSLMI